jgi:hypothetical protein
VSQASSNGDDSSDNGHSEPSSNLSPEQLQDALKKARADAAKSRVDAKRLAELEAAEMQRAEAALSDKDRYEKKISDLQAKLAEEQTKRQEQIARADIRSTARELGLKPELALRLIDPSAIEFGEDGDPKNVAALLRTAADEYGITMSASSSNGQPQQPHVSSGGAVNPSRTSISNNGLFDGDPQTVMQRVSKLAPSEYAAQATAIQAYMTANWNKISGR